VGGGIRIWRLICSIFDLTPSIFLILKTLLPLSLRRGGEDSAVTKEFHGVR
jgi:hypothetical protein